MNPRLLLATIFLLLASFVSAEEITVEQEEYWLGETVQAEIVMEGFDFTKLSLLDNQSGKVAVGFLTLELDDRQFIYFNIPVTLKAGEYTLTAKDKRVVNDEIQDFEMSAKILVTEKLGVSINPAMVFIDPLKDEFKIELKNNAAETINVNVTAPDGLKPARKSLQLEPGDVKNAFISYTELTTEQQVMLNYLNRSYTVRVIPPEEAAELPGKAEEPAEEPIGKEPAEAGELKFDGPETVEKEATKTTSFSDAITAKSTAGKELHNIRFKLTGNLGEVAELKTQELDKLEAMGEISQYIWVNKDRKASPGVYSGNLEVTADGGYSDTIHMKIILKEPEAATEAEEPSKTLFDQQKISVLINETAVKKEEPSAGKNVAIALGMLAVVLIIAIVIGRKLSVKTLKKTLEEYVKTVRKRGNR